ncbi:MAG: hypothetical protein K2X31_01460 [Sphingopyxis sp.]|nr:hypothetical protein [Sphingopyxis sp.]
MVEPKPLASLSAGLLARKGAARPAMRRQAHLSGNVAVAHDDLGWNDMGYGQMGYDVDPGHGAGEEPRVTGHGLTPMGREDDAVAMRDLSAAIDQVIIPASQPEAVVAPIQAETPIPVPVESPQVHRQIERIEQEYAPVAEAQPAVPVAAAVVAPVVADVAPAAIVAPVAAAAPPAVTAQRRAPAARARAGSRGAFAFTLRLDPERHLRLRLASATSNRSLQQILVGLVDDFLASQPEIDAFAARLPGSRDDKSE